MIEVDVFNHEELARARTGRFKRTLAGVFNVDVAAKVDQGIAATIRRSLAEKDVEATVCVVRKGRINIAVGGFKGMFLESEIKKRIEQGLRVEGVKGFVRVVA